MHFLPIGSSLFLTVVASGSIASAGPLFSPNPSPADVSNARLFEEPLFPVGQASQKQAEDLAKALDEEAQALAKALDAYVAGGKLEDLAPVQTYLETHPNSPWRISLLVNVGLMQRHVGRITKAVAAWESAWSLGKGLKDPNGIALAHRALGELLEANAGLGRQERLEALVKEAERRSLSGLITEKLSLAKESLTYMRMSPETAFHCGPTALAFLKAVDEPQALADVTIHNMASTDKGTSLAMNEAWATQIGLKLQMAKRTLGSDVPVPSVIHLKAGHFAAAMASKGGRVLLQDPFLGDTWMSLAVLDEEASGYALIRAGELPNGWQPVAQAEGETVWGKGAWGPGRPDDTRPDSEKIPSALAATQPGLPRVAFHANLVSLNLDIPASRYTPIRGPRADVTVTYNQREYGQPQVFDYCNLGDKWTFSYLACLKDDSTNPDFNVTLCNPGGGGLIFQSRGDGTFLPEGYTQAQLTRTPANTYVIEYLDGHKDFYEIADRAWGLRRVVITRRQDRFGNEVKFGWDAKLRLVSLTDAAGQVTKLGYECAADPLKLTSATDPFGRTTRFEFDARGRLVRTINPRGEATTFSYGPDETDSNEPQDFLRGIANGRETLRFREGETLIGPSYRRWLEVNDAEGKPERLESGAGYAYEIDPEKLPNVPELDPAYHPITVRFRESFYWKPGTVDSKKLNYRKAMHIRWGHGPGAFSSGIKLSEMEPGAPRHWFVHAGDFWGGVYSTARGTHNPLTPAGELKPGSRVANLIGAEGTKGMLAPVFDGARKLVTRDYWVDGKDSVSSVQRDFDLRGHLLREGDAESVKRVNAWDAKSGDLISASASAPSAYTYDDHHRLHTWAQSGYTWTATYDPAGDLSVWDNGKGTHWAFQYDARGRLEKATSKGQSWMFTFDAMDHLQSLKGTKGAVRSFTYDPWDRLVKVVLPSGKELKPEDVSATTVSHKSAPDLFDLGAPGILPAGADVAFEGLLGGVNGPIFRRLLFPAATR